MDVLQPRAIYRRTATEDPETQEDDDYELRSIKSSQSFVSSKFKQPLLTYHPDYQASGPPPSSLKLTLRSAADRLVPKQLHGWKLGALSAGILAAFSLLINIIAAAWLGSHKQGAGLVEVYNGDCDVVADLDLWSHLAINVLSTLLLGGSNYCMQCLCAPTRADVDCAHQRWKFLDIGVPSVRNLRNIPRFRAILWWVLALSSIPLHLLYNSAFYKSLSTNDYDILFVTEGFVDGVLTYNQTRNLETVVNLPELQRNITTSAGRRYEPLDIGPCLQAYASTFLSDRRNLVFALSPGNNTDNYTVVDVHKYIYNPLETVNYEIDTVWGTAGVYTWICESDPNIESKIQIPKFSDGLPVACSRYVDRVIGLGDDFKPYGHSVQYCLSEIADPTCAYSGNIPIIAVVIICNFIKMVSMFIVAFKLGTGSLITIGDAVASFLARPDPSTKGRCLMSRDDFIKEAHQRKYYADDSKPLPTQPTVARRHRRKWASAASWLRWTYATSILLLALIVSSVLLNLAVKSIRINGLNAMSLHIGAVNPAAIISGWNIGHDGSASNKILALILVANLPQTIFSFLYLNLNALLMTMWLGQEWSDFASERKALRTSKPRGQQRSTHFLQLPYKISLPLMILSGVLHWLISQSIFLAVVAEYNSRGGLDSPVAIASCGYSPIAMVITIVLGVLLLLATLALSQRSYSGSIPLVGSCSLAISAACHGPEWDTDAALKPVLWGVVNGPGLVTERNGVGHCAFSSGEVEPVVDGKEYAGDFKVD